MLNRRISVRHMPLRRSCKTGHGWRGADIAKPQRYMHGMFRKHLMSIPTGKNLHPREPTQRAEPNCTVYRINSSGSSLFSQSIVRGGRLEAALTSVLSTLQIEAFSLLLNLQVTESHYIQTRELFLYSWHTWTAWTAKMLLTQDGKHCESQRTHM